MAARRADNRFSDPLEAFVNRLDTRPSGPSAHRTLDFTGSAHRKTEFSELDPGRQGEINVGF